MFLSLFVACSSEITPVQAENSNTDTNAQTDAVADVVKLEDGRYLVEGDMVLTEEQLVSSKVLKKSNAQSALFPDNFYEWEDNPTVEYYFVPANASKGYVDMSDNARIQFERALKDLSNGVALSFKEVSTPSRHTVYVYSFSGNIPGASSSVTGRSCVGKQSLAQTASLENYMKFSPKGLNYRTFVHEMLHVLGFLHEFQRLDRNQHLVINSSDLSNSNFDQYTGVTTEFDMASIMMYEGITPIEDLPIYDWIGYLPLRSGYDGSALKNRFNSETETKNLFYIQNYNARFLCRTTTGSTGALSLKSSASNLCLWDITTGTINLWQTSQYSGIVFDQNYATTIRSTESTRQGFGIFLGYQTSVGLSVQGGGIRYASKWIPTEAFYEGYVNLWNPSAAVCLASNATSVTVSSNGCSKAQMLSHLQYRTATANTNSLWRLIPAWNTNQPY